MIFESVQQAANTLVTTLSNEFVLASGCFDLLTRGHVEFLKAIRDMFPAEDNDFWWERLIPIVVGINSDESVRRLKGKARPYVPQADRAYMLHELKSVDHVLIFNEDTVAATLDILKPKIWVKGGDRTLATLDQGERLIAERNLTRIVFIPRIGDYSTTSLHKKLQEQHK